jgi:glycosyltransferase involved in cell wall biosynthesis
MYDRDALAAAHVIDHQYRDDLSVVVPMLNEQDNLPELYRQLKDALEPSGMRYEIIFVDDGSTDQTWRLIQSFAVGDPSVRGLRFRRNFGQSAAFAAGFNRASGAVVVTLDADLQNDPADIPMLVQTLHDQNCDIVSGWRVNRQDKYLSRKLPSQMANGLISWVTGVALHDYGCSLKAYRAEVVEHLRLYGDLHRFLPALASWMGVSVVEVPVNHRARQHGKSKYGLWRTLWVLIDLISVKFFLSFGTRPSRIFGIIGILSMLLGTLLGIYLTIFKLVTGADIGSRPMLLLAVLLVVLGVQFISTGLLAEMMVRIYYEAQDKPTYALREELGWPRQPEPVSAVVGR